MAKKKILFVCTHNSARSQMAEGIVNALYGDEYEAYSAGTEPRGVNPLAIEVLKEIGIDISHHRSKSIEEFKGQEFDYVVTVCDNAKENCPFFPGGKKYIHRGFMDPASVEGSYEEKLYAFRKVRDEIMDWIKSYFIENKDEGVSFFTPINKI
ncbi:arsenate reductase ArsC [Dictyoglomus thermophilum]|uniref:Arsenate reductase n=2 Tax=Dictyoglomus thermophilum TaxID=14 RepID=B5YCM4_DICT6|nr:arsenate reductase ArsC [Dictyoglomus thermophilum]ACI19105.1 arsenate reductase [Dictyoglomus thermophilum H-6-12]MCX7720142.1 arsenate reductase ArsC [Dictyoglomus thermophilum]TYT23389.1 arsenate reductase ArsC [Dictyoglomus thermophilum]